MEGRKGEDTGKKENECIKKIQLVPILNGLQNQNKTFGFQMSLDFSFGLVIKWQLNNCDIPHYL